MRTKAVLLTCLSFIFSISVFGQKELEKGRIIENPATSVEEDLLEIIKR